MNTSDTVVEFSVILSPPTNAVTYALSYIGAKTIGTGGDWSPNF